MGFIWTLSGICHNYGMDFEPLYLYILSRLGIKKLSQFDELWERYGSFAAAYKSFDKEKLNFEVEQLANDLKRHEICVLPYYDALYPKLLKQTFDPPSVLFYRGQLLSADEVVVAIVGTRQISSYGRTVLPKITQPLIDSSVTIISGLAYGIDAAAHNESVKNRTRTIAVLGSGLDDASIYPRNHASLAENVLQNHGLLLSEHPPGTPAYKQNFIARNRIIAGIALGTIIVECKLKSGALITADYAMDANRPVYAVPGPIYSPFSEGPHKLIMEGAMLIASGNDVLQDLNLQIASPQIQQQNFTDLQQRVLECMQTTPKTIDGLQKQLGLSMEHLIATLTELELLSAVRNLGAEGFIKI